MKKLIVIILVSFIGTVGAFMGNHPDKLQSEVETIIKQIKKFEKLDRIAELESSELTIQNLDEYMTLVGIRNKDIVLRQIILESGWLRSGLTRRYNNLLGMKYARIRPTLAKGTALGHARFDHWTDSVKDYVLWRIYWENKGHDTSNYYAFLKKIGYAESKRYIATLQSIKIDREVHKIKHWHT